MTELARVPRFSALRDFVRGEGAESGARPRVDRCELCAAPLVDAHHHVLDRDARALACACEACARLAPPEGRWRRVHPRVERLTAHGLDDAALGALGVPIRLAFVRRASAPARVIAGYPSPAGIAETLLDDAAWGNIVACEPRLADLAEDVEALLIHRRDGARDVLRVSIDVCFHLTGIVRRHWRGMSGGPEVTRAIERFFAELAP